jgi:hypothetical protein
VDEFLDKLLSYESGIDPEKAPVYRENFYSPAVWYWDVKAPGELIRDAASGEGRRSLISYSEYFSRLDVPMTMGQITPAHLRLARFGVVNPWGFIGSQIGEALLIETGHYRPEVVKFLDPAGQILRLDSYYSGDVPASRWTGGVTATTHSTDGGIGLFMATASNYWRGSFTGKDGIWSLDDMKKPREHTRLFMALLKHNLSRLEASLAAAGASPREALARAEARLGASVTLTGCLAVCHLSGVRGAVDFLVGAGNRRDEAGTPASDYVIRFSGLAVGDWLACSEAWTV